MKKSNEDLGLWFIGFLVILVIAFIIGWVLNIVAIFHMQGMSGMLVARVIGAFLAPVGAVLGYIPA